MTDAAPARATEPLEPLEPFEPTGIERILCIVAHPDDMEYGASAAVAAWTARGIRVDYLLLTAGEAGIRGREPGEVARLRRAEQQAACDSVGAASLTVLDLPDGLLEPGLELRALIAHEIRRRRPQALVTMTWELRLPWGFNHADHRACGLGVIDAARDADNPWLFTAAPDGSPALPAWKADTLIVSGDPHPTHRVDVSGPALEAGITSLSAHRLYLEALPEHPEPRELLTGMTREAGAAAGCEAALPVGVYAL
ncbi:PIG-L family deacetylase [Brevibacterium sp. 5221]|uniref:PIG-L family deacetylase n=1 Tax=Brevibacterium rongguiense TaxID=2695267 RepID=A0A6N9H776_9MICO|nr:PIG-L deacetylase family protein [Brevibacterium rongguiense]MYM19765.1 PIG-L family deacetylase [Brevibacterium rongguiense]